MNDATILSERQRKLLSFALWQFASDAHNRATAAGQDKEGRYFKPGAVTAFLTDARDATDLLSLLRESGPLLAMPAVIPSGSQASSEGGNSDA